MEDAEVLEEFHFKRVIRAFSSFSNRMRRKLMKQFDDWHRLSSQDQLIIPEYLDKLERIRSIFQKNQEFFNQVVSSSCNFDSGTGSDDVFDFEFDLRVSPTDRDYENLRSTLRQLVREWSLEGSEERSACFNPILNSIKSLFQGSKRLGEIKVLVPGAGLGRLAWEINRLGFHVQGNEFSLYMLLTSQLILNSCPEPFKHCIHPFAYPLSNHLSIGDSLRAIKIPDIPIVPGEISGEFSMTAGDFIEIYSRQEEREAWDCVVTCFFLDTAQNVIEYLRVIRSVLRPNGVWINHGPLQYHFESAPETSIELTWEEVVKGAERLGFEFTDVKTANNNFSVPFPTFSSQTYANNRLGLSSTTYNPIFSIAIKKD